MSTQATRLKRSGQGLDGAELGAAAAGADDGDVDGGSHAFCSLLRIGLELWALSQVGCWVVGERKEGQRRRRVTAYFAKVLRPAATLTPALSFKGEGEEQRRGVAGDDVAVWCGWAHDRKTPHPNPLPQEKGLRRCRLKWGGDQAWCCGVVGCAGDP